MGLKIDKDDIWLKMQAMVFQTSLCSLQMDGGYLVFDAQPGTMVQPILAIKHANKRLFSVWY